jgi:hypothetical protein
MLNSFQEVVFDALQCLPSCKRMLFQARLEFNHLKPVVHGPQLLFDNAFPKLIERPMGPLMGQLISHVTGRYPEVHRSFFSFVVPEGLPLPTSRPVVLVLDRTIPTDLYARALAHYLPSKSYILLSIGSFSNRGVTSASVIRTVMDGCKTKNAFLLFIVDELIPSFTIPAVIHHSHVTAFIGYYVLVSEPLFAKLPVIPNAMVIRIAKPFSMAGATRALAQIPTFRREAVRWEFPLIYLQLLLAHRDDFPIKLPHILPSAAMARDLWQSNLFGNAQSRELWLNTVYAMWRTMTNCSMTQRSMRAVLGHFFKDSVPAIPTVARTDFESEALLATESPPPPGECGLMIALSDHPVLPEDRPSFGWAARIGNRPIAIGVKPSEFQIKRARLINARYRDPEITIVGASELTLSIGGQPEPPPPGGLEVPIFDGSEPVGTVIAKCPGNRDAWLMSAVHILLPDPSAV